MRNIFSEGVLGSLRNPRMAWILRPLWARLPEAQREGPSLNAKCSCLWSLGDLEVMRLIGAHGVLWIGVFRG